MCITTGFSHRNVVLTVILFRHWPQQTDLGRNGHWRPAFDWCDICQSDFDIIIKLEEEPGELMYLLDKTHLLAEKDNFLERHNPSSSSSATTDEIESAFRNLSSDQKQFLNKLYEKDFELLEYDNSCLI